MDDQRHYIIHKKRKTANYHFQEIVGLPCEVQCTYAELYNIFNGNVLFSYSDKGSGRYCVAIRPDSITEKILDETFSDNYFSEFELDVWGSIWSTVGNFFKDLFNNGRIDAKSIKDLREIRGTRTWDSWHIVASAIHSSPVSELISVPHKMKKYYKYVSEGVKLPNNYGRLTGNVHIDKWSNVWVEAQANFLPNTEQTGWFKLVALTCFDLVNLLILEKEKRGNDNKNKLLLLLLPLIYTSMND